jgi:hypothetical protein
MSYDDDFTALKRVCGAFWAPVWVCAPPQSVERTSRPSLWAIRALFHAVWDAWPVCQAATKCWASPDEPAAA